MANEDKLKNAVEDTTGKLKESTGRATGDRDLEAEGRGDQASASLKKAGENIKDAFKS